MKSVFNTRELIIHGPCLCFDRKLRGVKDQRHIKYEYIPVEQRSQRVIPSISQLRTRVLPMLDYRLSCLAWLVRFIIICIQARPSSLGDSLAWGDSLAPCSQLRNTGYYPLRSLFNGCSQSFTIW